MIVHGGKDALHDRGTTNKALRFSSARRILEEFGAVQRLCAKHAGAGTIQSVSRFFKNASQKTCGRHERHARHDRHDAVDEALKHKDQR